MLQWKFLVYICHPRMVLFQALTRASAWNSDALGPKFGHHNLPKGVLDFHGAQPGGFQQQNEKHMVDGGQWTVDSPEKIFQKT